jgi:hypothetical protein
VGLCRDRGRTLLALTVLGGAILVVDLRLLGLGLKEERVRYVGQSAQPWLIGRHHLYLHHPPRGRHG